MLWPAVNRERATVFLSLLIQMPLAIFLGHYYDMKVFMNAGYQAASGLDPYQHHNLVNVFSNPLLTGAVPIIGYPPPWVLWLDLAFRISYAAIPNLFVYNFAIKVPIIASNVCLAYLVRNILVSLNAPKKKSQMAWLFLLFNPFVLLTSSAWGQFDSVVAFLCVISLYFLSKGMIEECAFSLALGVALKPIALPLIILPLLFSATKTTRKDLRYLLVFAAVFSFLFIGPIYLMGWSLPWAAGELTAHFKMAGGMTLFSLVEIFQNTLTLPSGFELLGYLWVPALIIGYYAVYRSRPNSMNELFQKAVGLMLIFFLTRTWLSEPNLNIILPLMLITVEFDGANFRNFSFLWIIPLVFMFLNTSFPQLFFLVYPPVIASLAQADQQIRGIRLIAKFLVVVFWQILSWRIVLKMLSWKKRE
jgi:hypothetical protein